MRAISPEQIPKIGTVRSGQFIRRSRVAHRYIACIDSLHRAALYSIMQCRAAVTVMTKKPVTGTKPQRRQPRPRLSVGLSENEARELLALKERHNVSMAWIGRQAILEFIEKYTNETVQLPLRLTRPHGGNR